MDNQEISIKFNNRINGDKQLKDYEKKLQSIYSLLSGIEKSQNDINKSKNEIKSISKEAKNTEQNLDKMANQFNIAFNLKAMSAYFKNATKFFTQLASMTKKSINYVENINLLEVAYQNMNEDIEESSKRIETFIDKMASVYGLDENDLARKFGIFKQMANAMELPAETAENLSELMVKMTNDIASLYNLDLDRASNALQSALAGQVRPIRTATGADITEKTLQGTVSNLGLDKSISQLSYVEKRLVMIISLTEQLKKSQGDYGRTIESVANQVRIMKEQWERLSRAIGNMFYPILERVLPYLNAIMMVLTEIFNLIASLLGFKMPEFDYSGLSAMDDATLDLIDGMNEAGDSADNLKNKMSGLRGFDKLNVISSPSSSGSASVGGASGGIDPKIMEAFNNAFSKYDDMLNKVRLKANYIKDDIMRWLGFTKEINALTGEVSWKYQGFGTTIKNILASFNELSSPLRALITLLAGVAFKKIITNFTKLGKTLVSTLIPSTSKLLTYFATLYKNTGMLNTSIKTTIKDNRDLVTGMNGVKLAIEGILLSLTGISLISSSIKSMRDDGFSLIEVIKTIGGVILIVAGSISTLIPIVTALGIEFTATWAEATLGISLIVSAIVGLIAYFSQSKSATDEYKESIDSLTESAKGYADTGFATINHIQELTKELGTLVDANGNVKASDEERVNYILTKVNEAYGTEYALIDGKITKNGEEIKSNGELISSIDEVMRKKKAESILNAYQDVYNEALRQNNEIMQEANELSGKKGELTKEEKKKLKELKEQYDNNAKTIKNYDDLEEAYLSGNVERTEELMKNFYDDSQTSYDKAFSGLTKTSKKAFIEMDKQCVLVQDDLNKKLGNMSFKATLNLDTYPATSSFNKFGYGVQNSGLGFSFNGVPYAKGGLPPVGQLFIANENGPELVGQIGGQSFVANQNQMMDLLDKKLGSAGQVMNPTFIIQVGDEKVASVVLENLQDMATSNGKPIVIGG